MKVLVVDDEPLVRLSLRRALAKCGHTVEEAEDGQSGIEKWKSFSPDLVFLDVLMPRLSGPDLLRVLPAATKGATKVVLMSAFTGEYDLEKAKALGAHLFIPKPFEDVFAIVRVGEELFRVG
ncbi:MAG TPA: response regulator [Bdellovibrionales bacterium]|nr:response regulator [Bdellovibrionales bacterium]